MNIIDLTFEEPAWPDLNESNVINLMNTSAGLTLLENAMASGKHGIAFRFDLPDGRTLIFQTSYELFETMAAALRGRIGFIEERNANK